MQRHVAGEEHRADYDHSSSFSRRTTSRASLIAEPALTNSVDTAKVIAQEAHVPVEERRFSPPVNEWDATRWVLLNADLDMNEC